MYQTLLAGIVLALLGYVINDIRELKQDVKNINMKLSGLEMHMQLEHPQGQLPPIKEPTYFVKAEAITLQRKRYEK